MTEEHKFQVITPVGRIMWPFLDKPNTEGQYASNKYECQLLIDKKEFETDIGAAFRDTVLKVGQLKIGPGWTKKSYNPIRDGDSKAIDLVEEKKYESLEECPYHNTVYFKAKSKLKPKVVGPDKMVWDDSQIAKIKSGDYARFVVSVWGSNTNFVNGKGGVALYIAAIQFVREGEPLAKGSAVSLFDDLEVDYSGQNTNNLDDILPTM